MIITNVKHIAVGLLLLCSLSSMAETKPFLVQSIDTLNNNVFLIYLKDENGSLYKSISVCDSSRILRYVPLKIKEGITASFSLTSIYQEQVHIIFHIDQYYKGVNVRGNKIPVESKYGVHNDIYMIANANGLDLYSCDIIANNASRTLVDKRYLEHEKDIWLRNLNFVKHHVNESYDTTEFIIYSPFDSDTNEFFSKAFIIFSRDSIFYYNIESTINPVIKIHIVPSELTKSMDELFITVNEIKKYIQVQNISSALLSKYDEYFAYYSHKKCQFEYLVPLSKSSCKKKEYELINKLDALIIYLYEFCELYSN